MGLENKEACVYSRRAIFTRPAQAIATFGAVLGILRSAELAVADSGYVIVPKNYSPGRGEQSFPWVPARENVSRLVDPVDEADVIINQAYAYSVQRGSSGDLYQAGATDKMNSTPGGDRSVGNCFPAQVASGAGPRIDGDVKPPAPGLPGMSFKAAMVTATLINRHCLKERVWLPPWTPQKIQQIKDMHQRLYDEEIIKTLVVNTSVHRGMPADQPWNNCFYGWEGDTMITTDFLEMDELMGPKRKEYRLPFDQATAVTLVDPARPNEESIRTINQYKYSFNRPVTGLYVGTHQIVSTVLQ